MYYIGMQKRKIFRSINICIAFLITLAFIFPPEALAARRRAGGGELAKFDFGNYAAGVGIGIGAMAVGGVINAGLTSAIGNSIQAVGGTVPASMQTATKAGILGAMGNSFVNSFTTTGLITNMSTFFAVSQTGRAVGAMGNYYGWKPSTTFLVSSAASGFVGGFMNPTVALGPSVSESVTSSIIPGIHYTLNPANYTLGNMLSGGFVGGVTGLASGAVVVAIDGNKINKGKEPGIGAQIAGMVTGVAVGNLTRTLIDPATYTKGPEKTWERVENPEIKNVQDTATAKTATADVVAKAKGAYGGAKELLKGGTWQDAKQAYNEGLTKAEESGVVKNLRTSAQLDVQKANKLASSDSGRFRYRHVLDADVWDGYAQPDGSRAPVKYEMAGDKIRHYSPNEVMADGRSYRVRPLQGNFVTVAETNTRAGISLVGQRLFEATFINTADMWPQLVTNSLVIAATHSLGKKQKWMAPLVSGVVGGIAGPLFSNLADAYALRPGIYIGEHHVAKSIDNIELVKGLAFKEKMGNVSNDMYTKLDGYLKNHPTAKEQSPESLKVLQRDLQGVLDKHGYKTKLAETNIEGLLAQAVKDRPSFRAEAERILNNYKGTVKQPAQKVFGLAAGAANVETQGMLLNKSVNQGLRDVGVSRSQLFLSNASRDMTFGLVEGVVSGGIQSLANKISENSPFAAVGAAYGGAMLAGAVRGVIWHATWKPSRNEFNDLIWMPKYSLATPERYTGDDRVWKERDNYVYPRELAKIKEFRTLTGLSPTNRRKEIFDRTQEGIVKTKEKEIQVYELTLGLEYPDKKIVLQPDATREQIRDIVREARELDFMPEVSRQDGRTVVSIFDRSNKLDSSSLTGFAGIDNIVTREIQPSLNVSILASLAQANREFLTGSFAFGTPYAKPENINALMLHNFVSNMRGYAMTAMSADLRYIPSPHQHKDKTVSFSQSWHSIKDKFSSPRKFFGLKPKREKEPLTGWLTPGIVSGYISGGSSAMSNTIMTSMGAVKPLADTLNIQHQRLVITNSRFVPVTVQNLDYEPWLAARKTSFYAPFPSDSFNARNKRGRTFLPNR